MTTLSSNRFEALMGGAREETDPLGNTKTIQQASSPRSKRDVARKLHTRVAGKWLLLCQVCCSIILIES